MGNIAPETIEAYFAAIRRRDIKLLDRYLATYPDIVSVREDSRFTTTGLHVACALNDKRMILRLLQAGAPLTITNGFHDTPLMTAVHAGHSKAVQILLNHGQHPDATDIATLRTTPLHIAARNGDAAIASLLIAAGAAIDVRDSSNWTPLHQAVIGHGSFDYMGEGPVHMYCHLQMRVLTLLLRHGADPNARGWRGATPLHEAASVNCTRILRLLLQYGADSTIRDDADETPLDRARRREYPEIVAVLQSLPG
ncbi:MAG: Ankyrin repeats (3 copies) [Chloroflexi bacterium ADurb.Bin222]|nr:MAG: Ankyrin repeats (3 copies) [Chloroflexi bacterium ADurb.Bin222]